MAETDNQLKKLFSDFSIDFAIWLLGDQVSSVRPSNIALLPSEEEIRADEVFEVTLTDWRILNLHIDFQGITSHRPMSWRVLDYISRIAETYRRDVCSVVIYIGKGAGSNDNGRHQVKCSDGLSSHPLVENEGGKVATIKSSRFIGIGWANTCPKWLTDYVRWKMMKREGDYSQHSSP
ncbi:MAG: hypothetical protein DRR19_14950 [Candidatus Parabeggiatoa sp. nov. 1]|nr:MAG: hypothetical protein DRR19_14950 [Gammaproteobacteria bacterium]